MPDPIRIALLGALQGTGAHVKPSVALEALTASQARKRPHKKLATIWEQLGHMVYWQDIMLTRLRGRTPSYPKHDVDGWPPMPPLRDSKEVWADLVAHFEAGLKAAERIARTKNLSALMIPTDKRTFADQLGSLAIHNSYHLGQIVTLRRMIGAWPPPSGADSW
ncbi:MAG: DinB family protein [candidate division Zixibacteria bacterium]|nr:DinB family protein [candidate division Zixibacteria bacterium]